MTLSQHEWLISEQRARRVELHLERIVAEGLLGKIVGVVSGGVDMDKAHPHDRRGRWTKKTATERALAARAAATSHSDPRTVNTKEQSAAAAKQAAERRARIAREKADDAEFERARAAHPKAVEGWRRSLSSKERELHDEVERTRKEHEAAAGDVDWASSDWTEHGPAHSDMSDYDLEQREAEAEHLYHGGSLTGGRMKGSRPHGFTHLAVHSEYLPKYRQTRDAARKAKENLAAHEKAHGAKPRPRAPRRPYRHVSEP